MCSVSRLCARGGGQRPVQAVVRILNRRGVDAKVELGEMEAERARPGTEVGKAAVCDPLAAVRAQQRVEIVEVRHQRRAVPIGVGSEPLPDRDEQGPERLVGIADLGNAADHRRRHPPRGAEVPELVPVEVACELPGAIESIGDRLRADVRVAVEVTSDPAAEAQRLAGPLQPPHKCPLELRDRIPEALLEEPEPLPDLVDDARPLGADLVGLPEQRDLLREAVLQPPSLRERRSLVIEAGQERRDPAMRLEDGAARGLCRMGGEDELDSEPRAGCLHLCLLDAAAVELRERIGERLARDPPLRLVFAKPADPVMLLRDVDELEEERERPQDGTLALGPERRNRRSKGATRAAGARVAGEGANPLLLVEEILALLLDEHLPEQVAEEAHVATERAVGGHPPSVEKRRTPPHSGTRHRPRLKGCAIRAGRARSRESRSARRAAAA